MKRVRPIRGFTLLEVLTAMAIVALMIGLLIPAIGTIKNTASTVKQKAQFHALEIALETFQTDTGDYPPSSYTNLDGSLAPGGQDGYCGSMKLAEAIVGLDGFGFHPKSRWRSDRLGDINGDGVVNEPLYYGRANNRLEDVPYDDPDPTVYDQKKNLEVRKGPYLELERANAVKVMDLYRDPTGNAIYSVLGETAYVLCDMFGQVKHLSTGKKTGMPILYFKADTSKVLHMPTVINPIPSFPWAAGMENVIYNVNENFPFLQYSPPWGNVDHPMRADRSMFYNRIKNPNYTNPLRPYRAQSFILLSAGADGLYGTSDDVYNIDENEK